MPGPLDEALGRSFRLCARPPSVVPSDQISDFDQAPVDAVDGDSIDGVVRVKRLTLHVGLPKTGTSLLQKMLNNERPRLVDAGWHVLTRGEFDEVTRRQHVRWRRRPKKLAGLDSAFEILAERFADAEHLVISHEDLLGGIVSFQSGRPYPDAQLVLERCRDILRPQELRVIVYLRRPDRYIESVYLQLIRVGQSMTFDQFLADYFPGPAAVDWLDLMERIERAVGRDATRANYFESIRNGARSFCESFAAEIGIGHRLSFGFATERVNRGYSEVALRIALAANGLLQSNDRRELRRFLDDHFSNRTHQAPILLTDELRTELLASLRDAHEMLHDRFLSDRAGSPYEL